MKQSGKRGLCPFCGTSNISYNEIFHSWKCNKCEHIFPTPSYGPSQDFGKEARWFGKTTAQLKRELAAEAVTARRKQTSSAKTTYIGRRDSKLLQWVIIFIVVFILLMFGVFGWLYGGQIVSFLNSISTPQEAGVHHPASTSTPTEIPEASVAATVKPIRPPTTSIEPEQQLEVPILEPKPKSELIIAPEPGSRAILKAVYFEPIDQHALNTPESVTRSIESLAAYLTEPAQNDLEKARAIFRWITQNISYDVEGYFAGNFANVDPQDVLATRKSVCYGYSSLFEELCRAAGLEVVTISGWGKGYGYIPGDRITGPTNHSWNAIKIDGGWYLIECTWGAGSINDEQQFVRKFEPYYFCTPPEQFIYGHLPENPDWQLLETPISKDEFSNLPYVEPEFFTYGLQCTSHPESVIRAINEVEINVSAPHDILIAVRLMQNGQKLPKSLAFWQRRNGEEYEIKAVFSNAGDYILTVFSKKRGDEGEYWNTLKYKIEVSEGLPGIPGFPEIFETFIEEGAYLYEPVEGRLKSQTTHTFRIRVPRAEKVAVIQGERWHHLARQGELFEGEVKISKGEVELCAKFPGNETYYGLLSYTSF
jgi:hypothetical protein